MDESRRRELKKRGKAAVERQSDEIRAAMKAANPAALSDPRWGERYKQGVLREKWLRKELPVLHKRQLEEWFVVLPNGSAGWRPHLGGYVVCQWCGSAAPTAIPRRLFYWRSCECGNIRWRCIGPWQRVTVLRPELTSPVTLIGKG
jgi:hypothetical protein